MGEAVIEMNELVPIVIEEEFDLNVEAVQNEQLPQAEVPPAIQALQAQLPEDMLMDGDENAAGEADVAQDQHDNGQNDFGLPPDNIQLGFVEIANNFDTDPGLENFLASKEMPFLPKQNAAAVRLWAKHFNVPNQSAVKIPFEWSNFYITLLLSPTHFSWASTFLLSKAWDFFASDKGNVLFAIPPKCPSEVG